MFELITAILLSLGLVAFKQRKNSKAFMLRHSERYKFLRGNAGTPRMIYFRASKFDK